MSRTKDDVERLLAEKQDRLAELEGRHKNKKDCSHKEYSDAEDVKIFAEIEDLEDEIAELEEELEQAGG